MRRIHDAIEDLVFSLTLGVLGFVLIGFLAFCALAALDTVMFDRGTFQAQTACIARRMSPQRKLLSAEVVCVPIATRQDTTTVNLNQTVRP